MGHFCEQGEVEASSANVLPLLQEYEILFLMVKRSSEAPNLQKAFAECLFYLHKIAVDSVLHGEKNADMGISSVPE